jgi:hypothetical protein
MVSAGMVFIKGGETMIDDRAGVTCVVVLDPFCGANGGVKRNGGKYSRSSKDTLQASLLMN